MTMHSGKFVAYYRVSTDKQGHSGLGLEAQRELVNTFLNGGKWSIVGEFTEVESGTRKKLKDRPGLKAALDLCSKQKATLVVAKLDRLARDVQFISTLLNGKVPFVCADMPEANRTFMQMMSVMAEHEAKIISERTSAALQALKRRGKVLGSPTPKIGSEAGIKVIIKQADDFADRIAPILNDMIKKTGANTLRDIATGLSDRGVETRRGNTHWNPSQVRNLLLRLRGGALTNKGINGEVV
jgi:DNA invertase Pin-like site-specific DNA recombinase